MTPNLCARCCALAITFLAGSTSNGLLAVTLYVATDGNDAHSGRFERPTGDNADGPLATLEGARDKIRLLKKKGPLPAGGVAVVLSGGKYLLPKTFQLGKEDSGTADAPIVYRAAESAKVELIGGRPITGFVPYRGSILKADVAGQGFKGIQFRQLFCAGRRQILARWPNFDPRDPVAGGWAYVEGNPPNMYQDLPNDSRRTFEYKAEDTRNWQHPEEAELLIYPRYNWGNSIVPIASLDRQKRTITLARDAEHAIRPGDRYYVYNLFEELDSPGEWYLDRQTQTLYFWPPSPKNNEVYAPRGSEGGSQGIGYIARHFSPRAARPANHPSGRRCRHQRFRECVTVFQRDSRRRNCFDNAQSQGFSGW
jgi:hypothetical protein